MNKTPSVIFYYCGYEKCMSGHSFGPKARPQFLLHFVISGKGTLRKGKKTYHIKKNQGFLIFPKEVTYYEADKEDPWEYVWFSFDGEEAQRMIWHYGLTQENCICKPNEKEKLESFLEKSLECFKNPGYTHDEIAGWFYLFFSTLKKYPKEIEKEDKDYTSNVLDYIENNYTENISIESISEHLNIARSYLYKLCKNASNLSPKEYLTKKRLLASKDMLMYTKNSITEIALACGFHDSSSFSKTFRKVEKQSPTEFRKVMQSYLKDSKKESSGHVFVDVNLFS